MSRIGEQLVQAERITNQQLEEALAAQKRDGGRIGTHLIKLGLLDDDDLVEFLSQRYGVPAIALADVEVDETILKIIPPDVCRKYTILPVSKEMTFGMMSPARRKQG